MEEDIKVEETTPEVETEVVEEEVVADEVEQYSDNRL